MTVKTIDAHGIAKLAGSDNKGFALLKRSRDPSFPKPVGGAGVAGDRYVWGLAEIRAWLKTYTRNKTPAARLDNAMAQLVIRLGFKRGGRAIAGMAGMSCRGGAVRGSTKGAL